NVVIESLFLVLEILLAAVDELAIGFVILIERGSGVALQERDDIAAALHLRNDASIGREIGAIRVEHQLEGGMLEALTTGGAPSGLDHPTNKEFLMDARGLKFLSGLLGEL